MKNFGEPVMSEVGELLSSEKQSELDSKGAIFTSIVLNQLIENIEEVMELSDYSEEQISSFKERLNNLSDEEVKGVIAIPKELQERTFADFKKRLDKGELTLGSVVEDLSARAKEMGYTLGYHLSNRDILPEKVVYAPGEFAWAVNPSELDDRDDMQMAYYSLNYKNLFRKHSGGYLYVVRAETGESTPHKRDQSNNWGRAQKLSIVEKFNMSDLDKQIDTVYSKIHNQEKTSASQE